MLGGPEVFSFQDIVNKGKAEQATLAKYLQALVSAGLLNTCNSADDIDSENFRPTPLFEQTIYDVGYLSWGLLACAPLVVNACEISKEPMSARQKYHRDGGLVARTSAWKGDRGFYPQAEKAILSLNPKLIVDLGAGSAKLLIRCLKHLPRASGIAIDISGAACAQARENAAEAGVGDRLKVVESSIEALAIDSSILKGADVIHAGFVFHDLLPEHETVGALFHQIQCFCASTRPGRSVPAALEEIGLSNESKLIQEIAESEEDHGPELATMAGFILNKAAGAEICSDLYDQEDVEAKLKDYSDKILGSLPGYDPETGLMMQTRKAISVFDRRKQSDRDSTYRNLGTALALEIISNRQLIPGEKHCFVDSGIYGTSLEEAEMHYLLEHWGETGAEEQHEKNAMDAVSSVLNEETAPLIVEGADEFLDSLAGVWDLLDSALLHSGYKIVNGEITQAAA